MNAMTEMFLSEYFFTGAILGKYLGDAKSLFLRVGKLFYIPESELDRLFAVTEEQSVKEISSEKEFALYQRIKKYSALTEIALTQNGDVDEIIAVKGNVLSKAAKLNLVGGPEVSHNILYNNLVGYADCGLVDAMRVLGILQCEGIFVEKNISSGIKNLSKCADWNDCKSLVALLHYNPENREYNLSRLYMLVKDTPFFGLYEQALKDLQENDFKPREIKECKLLKKAFNAMVLKCELYEAKYARVLYSKAIGLHDKEKTLFNKNQDAVSAITDLPLRAEKKVTFSDLSWLGTVSLYRETEQEKIAVNLKYNTQSSYRPLCLCSDCKYLLNMYAKAIQSRKGEINIEGISVGNLVAYDLEPTANNIFIRNVDEDRPNIFLMYITGDVSHQVIEYMKVFLQTEKRRKFHLGAPNVTLDLSNVLPIVFSDRKNAQKLSDVCDTVELAEVSQEEKTYLISDIIESKKHEYSISQVNCTDDAIDYLTPMAADDIERCIDRAIRTEGLKSDAVQLNQTVLTKYRDLTLKLDNIGFGFGRTEL